MIASSGSYLVNTRLWPEALQRGCRRLAEHNRLGATRAVVLSGNGPTITPVDQKGAPLHHAVLWMDQRGRQEAEDREAEVARLVSLGAEHLHDKDEWGHQWSTLRDPEGNEFCVSGPHA